MCMCVMTGREDKKKGEIYTVHSDSFYTVMQLSKGGSM